LIQQVFYCPFIYSIDQIGRIYDGHKKAGPQAGFF